MKKYLNKTMRAELLPGILPPVFSTITGETKHVYYIKDNISGCPSSISKSHLRERIKEKTITLS